MRRRFILHSLLPAIILASLLSLCLGSFLTPRAASAHAYVIGSDPIDGSTIVTAPKVVRIFFNAPISSLSIAQVYAISTQDGGLVNVGNGPSFVSGGARELDVPLKPTDQLPQGGYEVKWTAVANDDGHTTLGLIGFNLGHSSTGLPGVATLGPSTSNNMESIHALGILSGLSIAWEWLVLLALALWIGILVIERFLPQPTERASTLFDLARKQTRPLQWLCLTALLVGEVVTLLLRAARIEQVQQDGVIDMTSVAGLLTHTTFGALWLIRVALIILACLLLHWLSQHQQAQQPFEELPGAAVRTGALRQQPTQERRTTVDFAKAEAASMPNARLQQLSTLSWGLLAGLILLTYALTSEAVQVIPQHISAVVFEWLYRAALCVWFGSSAYLGIVVLPIALRSELERYAESLILLLRRLMPLQLISIGVALISALFLGEVTVAQPQWLLTDPYGRTLIVQNVLMLACAALSLYTLLILRLRLGRQVVLLPVVDAELPARRARQSALEQTGRGITRLLRAQSLLAAGVLLCVALMAFFAPPIVFPNITYANPAPADDAAASVQTQQVGDLSISLQVLPGQVGATNTIIVMLRDRSGQPVSNAQVRLHTNMVTMDMGTVGASLRGTDALYTVTLAKGEGFSMAGLWNVSVVVQRPGHADLTAQFPVMIGSS